MSSSNSNNANAWDSLDLDSEAFAQAREENEAKVQERASLFYQCFSTDAGQRVLGHLVEISLDKFVLKADSTQFAAGIREGENGVVRYIQHQMRLAGESARREE
jgi:hypothetical protein